MNNHYVISYYEPNINGLANLRIFLSYPIACISKQKSCCAFSQQKQLYSTLNKYLRIQVVQLQNDFLPQLSDRCRGVVDPSDSKASECLDGCWGRPYCVRIDRHQVKNQLTFTHGNLGGLLANLKRKENNKKQLWLVQFANQPGTFFPSAYINCSTF